MTDPVQPTHTVWVWDWRGQPVEYPAVNLGGDWVLIFEDKEWKQKYRRSCYATRREAIYGRLEESMRAQASAAADVARCQKMLDAEPSS